MPAGRGGASQRGARSARTSRHAADSKSAQRRRDDPLLVLARNLRREAQRLVEQVAVDLGMPPAGARELARRVHVALELGDTSSGGARTAMDAGLLERVRSAIGETIFDVAVGVPLPGRIYCFQCRSASCRHAAPAEPDAVFVGYGATGKPRWQSFVSTCLDAGVRDVDRLFGASPDIVSVVHDPQVLDAALIERFRKDAPRFRVLAQVTAGLLPAELCTVQGGPRRAVTFQVVEAAFGPGGVRIAFHSIGLDPIALALACEEERTARSARQLQRVLRRVRQQVDALGRSTAAARRRGADLREDRRVGALAASLRADLDRVFRVVRRRTEHAADRADSRRRPTSPALREALAAPPDHFFVDSVHGTVVVVGRRGRAHVFSRGGVHVTSFVLDRTELERRVSRGRFESMAPGEVETFRTAVRAGGGLR